MTLQRSQHELEHLACGGLQKGMRHRPIAIVDVVSTATGLPLTCIK